MRKKQHANCLSNTSLKKLRQGKYNRVKRDKPFPDVRKDYDMRPDGWRRKLKEAK
jgi:hypothetical protein